MLQCQSLLLNLSWCWMVYIFYYFTLNLPVTLFWNEFTVNNIYFGIMVYFNPLCQIYVNIYIGKYLPLSLFNCHLIYMYVIQCTIIIATAELKSAFFISFFSVSHFFPSYCYTSWFIYCLRVSLFIAFLAVFWREEIT